MNTTIKRIFSLLLCFLLILGFSNAEGIKNTLTIGVIANKAEHLNPLFPADKDIMCIGSLAFESLVTIDDNYMPAPGLAASWDNSENADIWTFYLRDGAKFSNGEDVTAEDVVATVEFILNLAKSQQNVTAQGGQEGQEGQAEQSQAIPNTVYSSLKYFISKIEAIDSKTVRIKTSRKNFGFLYAMNFPVLPKNQLDNRIPDGSGPYKIENFINNDVAILSLKEGQIKHEYTPKHIKVVMHSDTNKLMESYEFNRVDSVLTRSLTAAQYKSSSSSLNFHFMTRQLETLIMNNSVLEFRDEKVRQALRYLINPEEIMNYSYFDLAERTDTPVYPNTWAYNTHIKKLDYSFEKAMKLLDEAGWVDTNNDGVRDKYIDGKLRKLRLRFIVYEEAENNVRIATANLIAERLKLAGIQCNKEFSAEVLSFADAQARLRAGSFDIALVAYNMDQVPDPGFMLMSRNTGNFSRYSSSKMDELFKTLRSSKTQEEYKKTLDKIQALFWHDCPFICLYYRRGAILTRKLYTKARDLREPFLFRGIVKDGEN